MRIFYSLGEYISFHTSGLAYIDCLKRLGHDVVTDPAGIGQADCAIIHTDPVAFADVFAAHPRLRDIRTIGYVVWEGSHLPDAYKDGMRLVDAVWTCSRYSQKSISEYFPDVAVVPHVVERFPVSAAALEEARSLLGPVVEGECLFFSIIDAINPRKNVKDLLFAFAQARAQAKCPVRLMLKQYRATIDFSFIPGVISITGDLRPDVLHALHLLSHAYVSAHHAEGWGLGLSQAMAYGKPVIATGYSGNMDFMNEANSFPLPYSLVPVSEDMCRRLPWFTQDMLWAQVDLAEMTRVMKQVAEGRYENDLAHNAAAITRSFGPESVAAILGPLLEKGC